MFGGLLLFKWLQCAYSNYSFFVASLEVDIDNGMCVKLNIQSEFQLRLGSLLCASIIELQRPFDVLVNIRQHAFILSESSSLAERVIEMAKSEPQTSPED